MIINTKRVAGRRTVRYANFDELLADAERATAAGDRSLGNWTPGQIFQHLATTFETTIDGFPVSVPWPIRFVARFFRRRLIYGAMSPGFRLPARAEKILGPPPTETSAGLESLRKAIARLKSESHRAPNAVLGPLTPAESDQLQLNHAAMHMSFIVPR